MSLSLFPFLKIVSQREGLTVVQNNIYRNFNILLIIALLDVGIILFSLKDLQPGWPFQICIAEFICLFILLLLHIKGYLIFSRYATFIITLLVQATACIIHGKTAGFDYLFYAQAVLPMLFFDKPQHYVSLFIISIGTMLFIQYQYTLREPIAIIPGELLYYWNIFFTGALVLLVMYIFKSGYEQTQQKLLAQHTMIAHQKEEIEVINNNLEQLIVDRTEKIKDQEKRMTQFAFINAHKVRSPLARIMGLLNLIELEKNKDGMFEQHLPTLRSNAEELNEMLKEVSDTLNGISIEKKDI
jgi:signal transduction histidine kinase